jgi:hypothetical protein
VRQTSYARLRRDHATRPARTKRVKTTMARR